MPRRSRLTYPELEDEFGGALHERRDAGPTPPARDLPQHPSAGLLALQQTAGNQAVLRLIDMGQVKPSIKKANRWFNRDKSSLGPLLDAVDSYNEGSLTVELQLGELKAIKLAAQTALANPNKAKYQPAIRMIAAQVERETKQIIQDAIDAHTAGGELGTLDQLGQMKKLIAKQPDKSKYSSLIAAIDGIFAAEEAAGTGVKAVKGKGIVNFRMTKEAKERQEREAEEAARRRAEAAQRAEAEDEEEEAEDALGGSEGPQSEEESESLVE